MTEITIQDLNSTLARIGVEANETGRATTFEELELDSLALLELQVDFEQRFGVDVAEGDLYAVNTLGEAIDLVNQRLQVKV